MPKRRAAKTPKKKTARKRRPYTRDKRLHRRRRRVQHHGAKMVREQKMMNYLLHQMLKTVAQPAGDYAYLPRHHSKNPEYASSDPRHQEYLQGVPAPDTHFWRPPGPPDSGTWTARPYRGNA